LRSFGGNVGSELGWDGEGEGEGEYSGGASTGSRRNSGEQDDEWVRTEFEELEQDELELEGIGIAFN
jgi:hypothetical protein